MKPDTPLPEDFISMDRMYEAYKKAKVDTFYDRSQAIGLGFAQFEASLSENLTSLRTKLVAQPEDEESWWFRNISFFGRYAYIPKTIAWEGKDSRSVICSDPWDEWEQAKLNSDIRATFRPVAQPTVAMHVVSALWVNLIGHKFDACLTSASRGTRLRRILTTSDTPKSKESRFHTTAIGSFYPYFDAYRNWRDEGLRAITRELESGNRVVAMTMDLSRFYHNIDSDFLTNPGFLDASNFREANGSDLSGAEQLFTAQLTCSFRTWAESLPTFDPQEPVGIPVGLSCSPVIANVLLSEFDILIEKQLAPVFYARYVDDIFLVIRENSHCKTQKDLLQFLSNSIPHLNVSGKNSEGLEYTPTYAEQSRLVFGAEKQQVFLLNGSIGQDFVDTIRARIDEVSSEWRLMPDLQGFTKSPAARVLTANKAPNEDADALRKADSLSVKRLSLASLLRQFEAAARDLPGKQWREPRAEFFDFAERHLLTPFRIFDFEGYLPRMLSLAVECCDWKIATRFVRRLSQAVDSLQEVCSLGAEEAQKVWLGFRRYLRRQLRLAVLRAVSPDKAGLVAVEKLFEAINKLQPGEDISEWIELSFDGNFRLNAQDIWLKDLAKRPLKEALLEYDCEYRKRFLDAVHELPHNIDDQGTLQIFPAYEDARELVSEFLSKARVEAPFSESVLCQAFLLPTRPLSPSEVTEVLPSTSSNPALLAKYVRALRGTYVRANSVSGDDEALVIGGPRKDSSIRLSVVSLLVSDESWAKAAGAKPDLSLDRYQRLTELTNQIVRVPKRSRPHYVLFPELSIPRRWLPTLASHFGQYGISVIAGAEYRHEDSKHVFNEAKIYLQDYRLGYRHQSVITQQKIVPAHGERDNLWKMFGLTFGPESQYAQKRLFKHFGFQFGVLVCSELTDIQQRARLRGAVDALFVLSWNRDLDSFAALVDSSALDIHCFIGLANNRKYGDGRVRAPYSDSWKRDLIRIKGGLEDYFVITQIEYSELRRFQSHHESPNDPFKPTPEGFQISRDRWMNPGA